MIKFYLMYQQFTTLSVCLMMLTAQVWGQSKEERKKIMAESNTTNLQRLAKKYKKTADEASVRVREYCKLYKMSPIRISKMNEVEIMTDVVDGNPEYMSSYSDNIIFEKNISNDNTTTTSTNRVQPGGDMGLGLTGTGIEILNWDNGKVCMQYTPEFGLHRISDGFTQEDRLNPELDLNRFSEHGQQSISVMIAQGNGDAKVGGMASRATAKVNYFIREPEKLAADSGSLLSNHSNGINPGWGRFDTVIDCGGAQKHLTRKWAGGADATRSEDSKFGYYSEGASFVDELCFNQSYILLVWAAGNDRGENKPAGEKYYYNTKTRSCDSLPREKDGGGDGYDCIAPRNSAKNLLSVGAVSSIAGRYKAPIDVKIKSYSGWGPTDDGRIKPDIVANTDIWTRKNCAEFANYNGTSAATPVVTGAVALLQEHFRNLYCGDYMKSAAVKALLIHTAEEAGSAPGPDYMHGWGIMNTAKAAQLITDDKEYNTQTGIRVFQKQKTHYPIVITKTQPFKVTVCWTDAPATFDPDIPLNNRTKKLVNDIDIVLKNNSNNTVYLPWVLDVEHPGYPATRGNNNTDNVEQIYVDTLLPGSYVLEITGKGNILREYTEQGKPLYGSTMVSLVKDKVQRPDSCRVIPRVSATQPKAYGGKIGARLSLNDCGSICRTSVTNDNGQELYWVVVKDGQEITQFSARDSRCMALHQYNNTAGEYDVFLRLVINREPKVISNVISYYVR
jgi:hypothetical protein